MSTVREALLEGASLLSKADTPFLDATVLLAHAMGLSKERLLASYPEPVPEKLLSVYREYIDARRRGIPVSYIRRKKEFYGLPFYVDRRVLVPRPDTETLIEHVQQLLERQPGMRRVLDLGTGSGCIAVTLAYLHPELELTAADISPGALEVAELNARHLLDESQKLVESDLFSAIEERFDLIISNPPYLTSAEVQQMKNAAWPEPPSALDGGTEGLDSIRRIVEEAFDHLGDNGYLVVEAAVDQTEQIAELLRNRGYADVHTRADLSGRDRAVSGCRPAARG